MTVEPVHERADGGRRHAESIVSETEVEEDRNLRLKGKTSNVNVMIIDIGNHFVFIQYIHDSKLHDTSEYINEYNFLFRCINIKKDK